MATLSRLGLVPSWLNRLGRYAVLAYVAYSIAGFAILGPVIGAAWGAIADQSAEAVAVWSTIPGAAGDLIQAAWRFAQ
jgi:hypothetical protein